MSKRVTIYLDEDLHRALDADDLAALEDRANEPVYALEEVLARAKTGP
ncbi:hypothetical protein BH20GEM1_BH20GEM1_23000 [soil metagenome]